MLPSESDLSEEQLQDYWKTKYDEEFCEKDDEGNPTNNLKPDNLLPKWARAYHNQYHKDKDPKTDEGYKGKHPNTDALPEQEETNEQYQADEVPANTDSSSDEDSDAEDLDVDPRAKRAQNAFYQNPDDDLHFRDVEHNIDLLEQHSGLINMSNPRGKNFMEWAQGQSFPPYGTIINRINELKTKKAIPDTIPEVVLNDKQRLFKDIVHDYVKKWYCAEHNGGMRPKPLRLFLMGAPGTGKSSATKPTMSTLKAILG